ncbi:pyridoxamine 5'-phosphate oxidase-related, FMN-binding protein [Candidatus Koribacter versatilis Ellin345]|uniref:Pyridoxamine 5'-phosphate oxidase-related, FMN-binding protein n=1 Tax=Koribacter versatilis (strain Ellin345) TaxID=204669 RepID=Q1IM51_KORVE|nr:pyridoxamine 5'-phosphate oxidase family protein [Candidatus Koribacter versatilis]ABF42049.1 pyridoxamine 5'-phosphate oxidase-related, FMN-binding protein [Candidatus Koribacter versatilis Ellin345]
MILIDRLNELIADIQMCMLVSVHANGQLHSRPMATQAVSDDGFLWFFTSAHSSKADEIRNNREVNVAYSDLTNMRFVSVAGTCELVRNRPTSERLWRDEYKRWFPMGLDDPELILLKVTINAVEYWDVQANRMRELTAINETVQLRDDRTVATDDRSVA